MRRSRKNINNRPRRRSRRRNMRGGQNDTQTIRFQSKLGYTFAYAAAATQNSIELNMGTATGFPTTSRIYSAAQQYAEYRVVKMKVTAYPFTDTTTSDNTFAIAYLPQADSTALAAFTFGTLQQLTCMSLVPALKSMPTTLSIGRRDLLTTPQNWFPTNAASPTINAAAQGTVIIKPRASATCTLVLELNVWLEFRIPTVNTMDGLKKLQDLDVRERSDDEHEDYKDFLEWKASRKRSQSQ